MKHKLSGPLIMAIGIAALIALGEWLFLMLLSLMGWAIIYMLLLVLNIPIVYWLVNIYYKTNCYTLEELWYEMIGTFDDKEEESERKPSSLDD